MISWFKKKNKTPKIPKERLTITTEECITLKIKATGNEFKFSIGKDENGTYYAITDPHIIPKFCLTAESHDEAYARGIEAVNCYIESVL